ncbi:MAG TPA: SMI1/KNR4 family protein [Herpetosiphonaceae bacterium]
MEVITASKIAPEQLIPCSEADIRQLEAQLGLKIPQAYREFLLTMGLGAGGLLDGTHCWYPNLIDLQAWGIELLEENNVSDLLPEDAFVFWMHQGYMMAFFRVSEGDDPPVYFFGEGRNLTTFTLTKHTCSSFLLMEFEGEAKARAQLEGNR